MDYKESLDKLFTNWTRLGDISGTGSPVTHHPANVERPLGSPYYTGPYPGMTDYRSADKTTGEWNREFKRRWGVEGPMQQLWEENHTPGPSTALSEEQVLTALAYFLRKNPSLVKGQSLPSLQMTNSMGYLAGGQ